MKPQEVSLFIFRSIYEYVEKEHSGFLKNPKFRMHFKTMCQLMPDIEDPDYEKFLTNTGKNGKPDLEFQMKSFDTGSRSRGTRALIIELLSRKKKGKSNKEVKINLNRGMFEAPADDTWEITCHDGKTGKTVSLYFHCL